MIEPTVEVPVSELEVWANCLRSAGYHSLAIQIEARIPESPWEPPAEWVDALTKAGAIGPYHILTALHDVGALRDE